MPITLGYSYFINPDYLVVKSRIHAILPFPDQGPLTRLLEYRY